MPRTRATAATVLPLQIRALRGFLCVVLVLCAGAARPAPPAQALEIAEIADGIFVHRGVHASLDDPRHDDIANLGFIIGETCVAVVDTGGSVAVGRRLLEAIRARSDRPICYVINTHVHYDHVLGNAAFRGTGAKFIGHAALADALAGSRDFFIEHYAADLGDHPGPESIIAPDVPVDGRLQLDLGKRTIELNSYPAAHTTTDLTVYDTRTETLLLGDLLFMERAPVLDGSLRGWLSVLSELEARTARQVVPGHGPASASWPQAATDQRRYLEGMLAGVRRDIAAGKFLEDVLDTTGQDERDKWQLFDEIHRRNLTKAFTELEWE